MAEDTMIKELISAYSLGCLDKKNQESVMEFLRADKLPMLEDLGTIQNVVSLLPLTLTPEAPRADLLLELNQRIDTELEKIGIDPNNPPVIEEKKEIRHLEIKREQEESVEDEEEEIRSEKKSTELPEEEISESRIDLFQNEDEPKPKKPLKLNYPKESLSKVKAKRYFYISVVSITATIFLLILIFVIMNSSSDKISDLEKKLAIVETKSNSANAFMQNYHKYLSFISQGNINVTTISDTNGFFTAKIHVSEVTGNGLVENISLPELNSNEEFKVYAIKEDKTVLMGAFTVSDKIRYAEINNIKTEIYFATDLIKIVVEGKKGKSTDKSGIFFVGKPETRGN